MLIPLEDTSERIISPARNYQKRSENLKLVRSSTRLKTELFTKENGKTLTAMASEYKSGQTAPSMKDTGRTTKPQAKVSFGMLVEISTTATGLKIKQAAMGSTHMQTELNMKENG